LTKVRKNSDPSAAMRRHSLDDDSLPVMVPRSDKALVPVSAARVRRLREHLLNAIRECLTEKQWERSASPIRPEPAGFAARVAQTACSLCKGWCCRNGDDDAFLDDRTLARVRVAKPGTTERDLLRLYLGRVPAVAYRDSLHFSWKARLHAGSVAARRHLQYLFLRRPRRLHEDPRGGSDAGDRGRRQ
jgi:hypothetical protein